MFPVLYSPNEPVYFLGFFISRIRICPCGSGPRRHIFMRIRADPDPKHWINIEFVREDDGSVVRVF